MTADWFAFGADPVNRQHLSTFESMLSLQPSTNGLVAAI
jgi:hypothetical protein